jgi:hypothetical protein
VRDVGISRDELTALLLAGRQKYSSIFNYPTQSAATPPRNQQNHLGPRSSLDYFRKSLT